MALAKGKLLHTMLLANDSEASSFFHPSQPTTASPFQSPSDLKKWAYGLGLQSSTYSSVTDFRTKHDTAVVVDGKTYPPTRGIFINSVNLVMGEITAHNNLTPLENCKLSRIKNPVLPKLAHWSDIAYLQWHTATCNGNLVPKLRSVVRDHVINPTTVQVVKAILSKREEWTPGRYVWHRPRYMFTPDSDDFKALLGTPMGLVWPIFCFSIRRGWGIGLWRGLRLIRWQGMGWIRAI